MRRAPDRYGDWVLNKVQFLQMMEQLGRRVEQLESREETRKKRIQKLKPCLLRKAKKLKKKLLEGTLGN